MKFVISPSACRDIEEIGAFIARDNPRRAASFLRELRSHLNGLTDFPDFPDKGVPRDELRHGLRMIGHGRYLVFYTVNKDAVRVERVRDFTRMRESAFN